MASLGRRPGAAPLTSADIPDNSITAAKIVDATIAAGDLAADSVDSSELVDGSIDTSHIGNLQVTTAKIAADAIDGTKIADDAVDSEHYAAGSIDTAHIADNQITLAKLAGGTDGQIITFDASGDPVAVGPGTDGQVLTSTGAGSPPAFEAAGTSSSAGDVLQMKRVMMNPSGAQTVNTTGSYPYGADLEIVITPASTSNYLYLTVFVPDVVQTNNGDGVHTNFFWDQDMGFGSPTSFADNFAPYAGYGSWSTAIFSLVANLWIQVPHAGQIKIRPKFQTSGNSMSFNDNHAAGDRNTMTCIEVKG